MDRITNAYPNWRAQKLQEHKDNFISLDAAASEEESNTSSKSNSHHQFEDWAALHGMTDDDLEISEKHFLECKEYEEKLFTKSGVQAKLLIPKHFEGDSFHVEGDKENQQNIVSQSKLSVKDCYFVGNAGGYSEPNELVNDETHHCSYVF